MSSTAPSQPAGGRWHDGVSFRRRWAWRLFLRIYAISLFAIVLVPLSLFLLIRYGLDTPDKAHMEEDAYYLSRNLFLHGDDVDGMMREMLRMQRELDMQVSTYGANGEMWSHLSVGAPVLDRIEDHMRKELEKQPFLCLDHHCEVVVAVPDAGGVGIRSDAEQSRMPAYVALFREFRHPPPQFIGTVVSLVLLYGALGALLLATSLARPIGRLAHAARALGSGDLGARARLERRDELGELGIAFDTMADQVAHLVKAQKELLANVSHELRTPLSRIHVALDIAAEGDGASVRESLADITEDLAEIEQMIGDIMTAARLDLDAERLGQGTMPLRLGEVDVVTLLGKSVHRFRELHTGRTLAVEYDEDLPLVAADATLLRRVIDNLLDNASKYSEGDSVVKLSVHCRERYIHFMVADDGIGIDHKHLEDVLKPFFRTDSSRGRRTGGVGLGLALAHSIVRAHGGTIALESTVGQGTRACFTIPIDVGSGTDSSHRLL